MQEAKIDISGSDPLPHTSILRRKVIFVNDWIELVEDDPSIPLNEPLTILLSSFGIGFTDDKKLTPCFDLAEMERRSAKYRVNH